MDKQERLEAHDVMVPPSYMPKPEQHLYNPRDRVHFETTKTQLALHHCHTNLDIGSYDGWLSFLLMQHGYDCDGVELVEGLAEASRRYAAVNHLPWCCYPGFFDDTTITKRYDCVTAYEVLEHIPEEDVPAYLDKIDSLAIKLVLISLPDQSHIDNPQHLYTPTQYTINKLMGHRDYHLQVQTYPGTDIPNNFFIAYKPHPDTEGLKDHG